MEKFRLTAKATFIQENEIIEQYWKQLGDDQQLNFKSQ